MKKRGAIRKKSGVVPNRQAILRLLKQQGPSDSETLAAQLDISAMAVRQHLYALHTQRLVTYQEEQRPIGRPAKMWCLTPAAESHFPDAHAGLSVNLLNAAEQTFGQEGVQRLVTRCAKQQIADYRSRILARAPLQARLGALISIRNEEGFMAEVQRQRDWTLAAQSGDYGEAERQYRREHEHLDAAAGVDGIEAFYERCVANGAMILRPLIATSWGTKDFYIEDPDGYIISFGGRPAAG